MAVLRRCSSLEQNDSAEKNWHSLKHDGKMMRRELWLSVRVRHDSPRLDCINVWFQARASMLIRGYTRHGRGARSSFMVWSLVLSMEMWRRLGSWIHMEETDRTFVFRMFGISRIALWREDFGENVSLYFVANIRLESLKIAVHSGSLQMYFLWWK